RCGRDLVLAQGAQRSTPAGELETPGDEGRQDDGAEDPERTGVLRDARVVRPRVAVGAAERREKFREGSLDAAACLGRRDDETEDLREAERDDCEIVTAQPQ